MENKINIPTVEATSLDVTAAEKEKLKAVFPECFSEGKLDIDKLLSLCGEFIDNDFEKYKFEWNGKSACYRTIAAPTLATLRPCPEESVDFDKTNNLYIEGDNLEVLKILQKAYFRKVKMIYIDPPYNTGNDFVYEDDYRDPLARYKEVTSQTTKSNPETMGRFHTNWLNMMYPRLRLAANLLRDDGVIFISIDDNEVTNLRRLCDEVFGEENFIAQFIVASNSSKNNSKYVSVSHEYALCYCKRRDALIEEWKVKKTNVDEYQRRAKILVEKGLSKEEIHSELLELVKYPRFYELDHYTNADERGIYQTNDPGGVSNGNFTTEIIHPLTHKPCKKPVGGWRYKDEEIKRKLERNEFEFGEDETIVPRPKRYLNDFLYSVPKSVFFFDSQGSTKWLKANNIPFDFAKAVEFIKYLLSTSSKEDDIILDFFSGSATTAHAVMQLNAEDGGNRRFIMVQLPELCPDNSDAAKAGYKNICEIGKERIRRAGAKIKEQNSTSLLETARETPLDTGFKVFKLDSSNLIAWDSSPIEPGDVETLFQRYEQWSDRIKKDRSQKDLVYEIMFKLGIPLTYPVTEERINGRLVHIIGEDCLVAVCLDGTNGGVQPEDIEALCEKCPAKIVASEDAFADNVALTNVHYILEEKHIELMLI